MKRTSIVLSVVVAVLMLFAAAKVGTAAPCDVARKAKGECFEMNGYKVEIVKDTNGNFPDTITTPGSSVFTYMITRGNTDKLVNWVDILIPACTPGINQDQIPFSCNPPNCRGKKFTDGSGDPLTGFGLGLTTDVTWKWDWVWPSKNTGGTVSLTLPGKVYASMGPMLLKLGLLNFNYPFGQILAPSCGLVPAPAFAPQVPLTTLKQETIGDVLVCTGNPDQSGCPTLVYNCDDPSHPWTQEPFMDISVGGGTLHWVGADSDPRCPTAYLITQSSTCIRRCNAYTGYCYVGPPGCNPGTSVASPQNAMLSTVPLADPATTFTISGKVGTLVRSCGDTCTNVFSPTECVVMSGLPGNPQTDSNGFYTAKVPSGWSGTVTPTVTGYTFTPLSKSYPNVLSDQNQDYVPSGAPNVVGVSGSVSTLSGQTPVGLAGVVMKGLLGETTCPPVTFNGEGFSGFYSGFVPFNSPDTVTVIPTLAGYTFDPPSMNYTNTGTGLTGQDYTALSTGLNSGLVPLTIKKQETIGNIGVCTESPDESGCATSVYSCYSIVNDQKVYTLDACNCNSPLIKDPYQQKTLSDITINPTTGPLKWVGADSDPSCPTAYIVTQGSTCVKRCNVYTGYCYVGPTGCKP